MTWFRVDDGFYLHPKVMAAGNAAIGLWVRAGSWCSANLTDGALPKHMCGTLGAQARDVRKLIAVGLWCETPSGYQFNDWDHWQETRVQVETKRAKSARRQKEWREGRSNSVSNGVTNSVTNDVSNSAHSTPLLTTYVVGSSVDVVTQVDASNMARSKPVSVDAYKIAKAYTSVVKLSDPGKVSAVVLNATTAGYTEAQIRPALERLAKDGRAVTADTLRIEIEGGGRKRLADGAYVDANGTTRLASGQPVAGKGWQE